MAEPMVWLPPVVPVPPERKGFRAFVEKHDALFTVLGAGIVFMGFFMKEGYQERSKELFASIKQAQFSSAALLHFQSQEVALAELSPEYTKDVGSLPGYLDQRAKPHLAKLATKMDRIVGRLAIGQDLYFVTESLYDALSGKHKSLEEERNHISGRFSALNSTQDKFERSLVDLGHLIVSSPNHGKGPLESKVQASVDSNSKYLDDLNDRADEIIGDLSQYHENVLNAAKEDMKVQESHVKWSTRCSFLLFVVGWGMGLLGKVLKLPALGGSGSGD